MTGRFKNVREARKAYGITRGVSQRFFKLLNLPPKEIEAMLYGGGIDGSPAESP